MKTHTTYVTPTITPAADPRKTKSSVKHPYEIFSETVQKLKLTESATPTLPPAPPSEKTKSSSKHPYEIFPETTKKLKLTEKDLCEKLGYARNSYYTWKNSGMMPLTAALLCASFLEHSSKPTPRAAKTCLITIIDGADKAQLVEQWLNTIGAKTYTINLS